MTTDQLLEVIRRRIESHPDWTGEPITLRSLIEFLSQRAQNATMAFGARPGLCYRSYAQQMAEIGRYDGTSLEGLA